jgi:hypothetical protein
MKNTLIIATLAFVVAASGCNKSDDGTQPPTTQNEDWNFPTNATKFSATLYTENTTVAVGAAFDVKVILYNVTDVFGAAFEIRYQADKAAITTGVAGPFFTPLTSAISVGPITSTLNKAGFGITYVSGSNRTSSGSGVIMKFKCQARAAGQAVFSFDPTKLEVKKADGTPIPNIGGLQIENLTVTIQ